MAVVALLNMHLTINSVDLSDHTRNVQLAMNATELSSEAMGDSWEETTGGLKAGTINFELLDDFASGSVDATLWSAFNTGTNVAVAVRPVNTTIGTTNPEYQFNVHPGQYQMGGALNTMAMKQLTWKITGAVTRDTTP